MELLNERYVKILPKAENWEEAISICAEPLIEDRCIDQRYVDNMIKTAKEVGPYFDLGNGIALPHSRPENGVNKKSVAVLKLSEPVYLLDDKDHPIEVIIVFAAKDNISHLDVMGKISNIISNGDKVEKIKNAQKESEIADIFNN